MSEPISLRTSEHEEAIRSLEWAAIQAKEISRDPYYWKWVLISLHNAAQGFMVLAMWSGNGLRSMPDKDAVKWLQAYRDGTSFPKDRLDKFLNLYKKCKDSRNFNYVGSAAFEATPEHDASFEDLNEFRNEFIHFTPKGWVLELQGLPSMLNQVLELIKFFGWESTHILWHEKSHRTRAKWAHRSLQRTMAKLQRQQKTTKTQPQTPQTVQPRPWPDAH